MLKGQKTFLRPLEAEDIPLYQQWYNDQDVSYWANAAWPLCTMLSEVEVEERFFVSSPTSRRFTILDENMEPIGTTGFRDHNVPARSAVLFISIGEQEYWGRGYGTDALRVLIDYLFLQWNFHRLSLDTWDGNLRALRSYEKLGFQVEGRLREARYVLGKYHDAILLSLLRDEYLENRAKFLPGKG